MVDGSTRFARCLAFVFKKEGGFVNDPRDPGGATNMGITIAVLSAWRRTRCSVDDVKNLKPEEATEIYRALYWPPADVLPTGLDLMFFNASVNCGHTRGDELLQTAVGADVDGVVGAKTLAAVAGLKPSDAIHKFYAALLAYYRTRHGWVYYSKNWTVRSNDCLDLAITWANAA